MMENHPTALRDPVFGLLNHEFFNRTSKSPWQNNRRGLSVPAGFGIDGTSALATSGPK
jgi:hypothetical protein